MEAGKRYRIGYVDLPARTKDSCFHVVRRTVGTRLQSVTLAEMASPSIDKLHHLDIAS